MVWSKRRLPAQTLLSIILLFAFITRVSRLHVPEQYVFDEVYHALTAKLIARNDPRAYEWWNEPVEENTAVDWLHPPLAKYTQAFFIALFGETSFAWRLSSALFGVGVIYLTYRLSLTLFKDKTGALLAAFLASLDGLLLVQSRIAMNDIHVTFFILLLLLWYWQLLQTTVVMSWQRSVGLVKVGVAGGLALGTKWSGVFTLGYVGLVEAYQSLWWGAEQLQGKRSVQRSQQKAWHLYLAINALAKKAVWMLFVLCGLPLALFVASYAQMFAQGKGWAHFAELLRQIWWYQTNLDATHAYQSRPLEWFFNLKPVWLYVNYAVPTGTIANIYAFGNPALFWIGGLAVGLTALYLAIGLCSLLPQMRAKKLHEAAKMARQTIGKKNWQALIFLFLGYVLIWLPWQFSPRIMFFYHYTPAVPLLTILLAFWLQKLSSFSLGQKAVGKKLVIGIVASIFITFIVWYPHWTALPVPQSVANTVYFAFKSWK